MNIDFEKLIQRNIEFKARDMEAFPGFDGGSPNYETDYHMGTRRDPVYFTKKNHHSLGKGKGSIEGGWNTEIDGQESPTYQDFPESSWIEARDYNPEHGILTIYFDPFETNGKPPVILGLGNPLDWSFVHSFDNGIQSKGNGYSKRKGKNIVARANSQGAFYKEYIQQYRTIYDRNGKFLRIEPNTKRVVDAVYSLEEIEEMLAARKNRKYTKQQNRVIHSVFHAPSKTFLKQLSVDSMKSRIKDYAFKKIEKQLGDKKWIVNKKAVTEKIINKLAPNSILEKVKSYNGAKAELSKLVNKKGAMSLATKGGRKAAMGAIGKGARGATKAIISEGAAEGTVMTAGAGLAPETAGVSVAIAAGVTVAMSVFKKQKHTERISKMAGKEAIGSFQIVAMKKIIMEDVKLHIKRVGVKPLVKGVVDHHSLKWSDNKIGINERKAKILNNRTDMRALWNMANEDASKSKK